MPRLEEWILGASKKAGIDVKDHGFPDRAEQLHKTISTSDKVKLVKFVNLITGIKKKSIMLKTLEGLIKGKI